MNDRNNTIAGWVLFAGIVALGSTLVAGEYFNGERPEKMGYPIEGVEQEGGAAEAEKPIAFYLASADPAKGAEVFKQCQSCHTADQGLPNGIGPNLYGVVGEAIAQGHGGFAFSDALKSHGGKWDWDTLSAWLTSPKKFANGTKMNFAGISNPESRANVMAFLNTKSPHPLPLPAAPAEAAPQTADKATADKAAAEAQGAGAQKGENEPVLSEQQAAQSPGKSVRGEGAPNVSAPGTTAPEKK